MRTKSSISFNYALASVGLVVLCVVIKMATFQVPEQQSSFIVGLFAVAAGISALIGVVYTFFSLKEPNTVKKLVGAVINFSFLILFIAVIVANIIDIYRAIY